ncbi:hypothetical protein LCGC14_0691060 [marine sediment metagenome]|uniref:Uncharacterized protein n=1 Tax=marine sediment metagenome TaxID=412755 RepID=A0A0F9QKF6_9ZZZZ
MENRLLNQFNNVIKSQWLFKQIEEPYETLTHRELFELAYHTCNSVTMRNIYIRLASGEDQGGSKAIMYSNTKKFTLIEVLENFVKITKYFSEESTGDKILTEIQPLLKKRKDKFALKDRELKTQILKIILVERKLDECANLALLKSINRKIYFAIGDARESAAVVPIFMEAEGASLVQLALNKWMETAQRLEQEHNFPDNLVPGLLKNIMQIKRWLMDLISSKLDE